MMEIRSELYSLKRIVDESPGWRFRVPIYQRLYVWGDSQVQTLLNDLINAFERRVPMFFLGGTLLVEQRADPTARCFDLIDGQQRFTTLWLLCCAWREALAPFLTVPSGEGSEVRLGFSIRPQVDDLLHALAFGNGAGGLLPEVDGGERIGRAIAHMRAVAAKRGQSVDWRGLTEFVFEQVQFVITTVPPETDLNKLFEVINNRGVQLQHHEILKARMLEKLGDAERGAYALLWEACADMDNYVERTFGDLAGLPAYAICEELHAKRQLHRPDAVRRLVAKEKELNDAREPTRLAEILKFVDTEAPPAMDEKPAVRRAEASVRSIIGFPLLLQHVLRIWRYENDLDDLPRVLDSELLTLFDSHFFRANVDGVGVGEKVRTFLDLLWRLRVLFDIHVIKWVDQGEEEVHLISQISISESKGRNYINRSRDADAHRGLALLQSMLYHSQEITTQYWLTPLLMHMHRWPDAGAEAYFRFLQHLDNHLLGSADTGSLAERTWSFIEDPWQQRELIHRSMLGRELGTGFPHYWFYKLEFVLWFQKARDTQAWRDFRLTAKNSVEHISPQTPTGRDEDTVSPAMLDRFGNLALVSRGINSEYGNLPFNEKQRRFLNKNRQRLDCLKMALIYEHPVWSDAIAEAHQNDMIQRLDLYVEDCRRNIHRLT